MMEIDSPDARLVTLVCDNLNTHDNASLYPTFDAGAAHRLSQRLRIVNTPWNGSWLNMAEIELSVLTRHLPVSAVRQHGGEAAGRRGLAKGPQSSPL